MSRRQLLRSGLFISGALAAGTLAVTPGLGGFRQLAPEFTGIDAWLNTPVPLSIAGSRGSVVLVTFWTYSCINSRRPMAYLKRWHAQYAASGLRVIGIHTPEFRFEHDRSYVERYVREAGIQFPVAQDNGYRTWEAWENDAWPGFHLVDRQGRIILRRDGEDYAHEMELALREALGLPSSGLEPHPGDDPDLSGIRSPELYYGAIHPTPQDPRQSPRLGNATYSFGAQDIPDLNRYLLNGGWSREDERLVQVSPHGGLRLRYWAAKSHIVASSPRAASIRVQIDRGAPATSEISWPTLYTLTDVGDSYREHLLEIESEMPGLTLFSTTFG
jgi:thiol-disulfide isomerase/thioredoxin